MRGVRRTIKGMVVLAVVLGLVTSAGAVPGAVVWTRRLNGPGHSWDTGKAVAATPDGSRVFVTGSRGSNSTSNFLTVAHNATGAVVWTAQYDGTGRWDWASEIALSPDGSRVYVTGQSFNAAGNEDFATVAYDATTGAQLWARRYNGPGHSYDEVTGIAASPDGTTVVVTGGSVGASGEQDFATVAYDTATGATSWARRYDGVAHGFDRAVAIAASADGSKVVVTGPSLDGNGVPTSLYATVAYSAVNGTTLWSKRFDSGPDEADVPVSLGISPDGARVFVAGTSEGGPPGNEITTVAYDTATGGLAWSTHTPGTSSATSARARLLAVSPDGTRVFVTGYVSSLPSGLDYVTTALDTASGGVAWTAQYDGPQHRNDAPSAIAVSPDGIRVFVTGWSDGSLPGVSDYATVVYRATTGGVMWKKRYDGPSHLGDVPAAVTVTGTRAFVTGTSESRATPADVATLAYRLT